MSASIAIRRVLFPQQLHHANNLFITRCKHSKTQVKRLFKNNPARLRLQKKANIENKPFEYEPMFKPVLSEVSMLPNGWIPPPSDEIASATINYPFSVSRTGGKPNGAVGFLPVYSDHRIGGTKHTTIIRKVKGNVEIFSKEMLAHLNKQLESESLRLLSSQDVRVRSGNVVEVKGNHVHDLRLWLASLGF